MKIKNLTSDGQSKRKLLAYIGIFTVVLVWGINPIITLELYRYYSPAFRLVAVNIILIPTYLILSAKHIREFNADYWKIGIPTGLFLALADVLQKVGLQYTTPAKYAFLENLSCITVPAFMFLFVQKKPTFVTWISCLTCLASAFALNATSLIGGAQTWGIGEILCGVAGLLYGVNIAATGAFAKKLYAPLYLAVQSAVSLVVALIFSLVLNFVTVPGALGDPEPMEKLVFSFKPLHLLFLVVAALISSAFCWIVRTNSMKYIEASKVAVIMPFSAVITSVISVLMGTDSLTVSLVVGGFLGLVAIILSGFDGTVKKKGE